MNHNDQNHRWLKKGKLTVERDKMWSLLLMQSNVVKRGKNISP